MHELCGGLWIEGAESIRASVYHVLSNAWIIEGWEGGVIVLLKRGGVTVFDPNAGDLMDIHSDNRCGVGRVMILSRPDPRALCVMWTLPEGGERMPLNDLSARVWVRLLKMLEVCPPVRARVIARRVG